MGADPLLRLVSVSKSFDGVKALDGVSLEIQAGEVLGVIGPNGAGKSTLAGVVAGWITPSGGRIILAGRDITGLSPRRRALLGVVATHQTPRVFTSLTVMENIEIAGQWGRSPEAERVAETLGLADRMWEPASSLSFGHRRLLELAMALVARPRLLVLDEPSQGLSVAEVEVLASTVRGLAGCSVILIDHRVDLVSELAGRVAVLDGGRLVALGGPREEGVRDVIRRVYLREEA
jgi:ABC-type branched-subunit amino acid transport system ATPase component